MEDSLQQDSGLSVGEESADTAAVFKFPDSLNHRNLSRDKVVVIYHHDLIESQLQCALYNFHVMPIYDAPTLH
jgi:hypothetical protein